MIVAACVRGTNAAPLPLAPHTVPAVIDADAVSGAAGSRCISRSAAVGGSVNNSS